MGCDIHLNSEVKIKGTWYHYAEYFVVRNYKLFSKMANVRNYDNEVEPISKPKGMPEDPAFLTKYICDDYGVDGHSHSWLSAEEISELETWYRAEWPGKLGFPWDYVFGNCWGGFHKYPKDRPNGVEDVRFVFWFDN